MWQCSQCPFRAKLKGSYQRHLESHNARSLDFVCPACGCVTKGTRSLKTHLTNRHPGLFRVVEDDLQPFNLRIIEAVRREPVLYNGNLNEHYNRKCREHAWDQVAEELEYDDKMDNLKKHWRCIRDYYIMERRKGKQTSDWPCFGHLQWIEEHVIELIERTVFAEDEDDSKNDQGRCFTKFVGSRGQRGTNQRKRKRSAVAEQQVHDVHPEKLLKPDPIKEEEPQPLINDLNPVVMNIQSEVLELFRQMKSLPENLKMKARERIGQVLQEMNWENEIIVNDNHLTYFRL